MINNMGRCTKISVGNCLFCATGDLGSNYVSIPGEKNNVGDTETVEIKTEDVSGAPDDNAFCQPLGCLEGQLKAIFVVRQLLELPEDKCVSYLQRNDGESNPQSWFDTCASCMKSVEEGYQVFRKIQELSSKLEGIKWELKKIVKLSNGSGRNRRRRKNDSDFICRDIRGFVSGMK